MSITAEREASASALPLWTWISQDIFGWERITVESCLIFKLGRQLTAEWELRVPGNPAPKKPVPQGQVFLSPNGLFLAQHSQSLTFLLDPSPWDDPGAEGVLQRVNPTEIGDSSQSHSKFFSRLLPPFYLPFLVCYPLRPSLVCHLIPVAFFISESCVMPAQCLAHSGLTDEWTMQRSSGEPFRGRGAAHLFLASFSPLEAQKETGAANKRLLMFYRKSSSTVTFFACANWWQ